MALGGGAHPRLHPHPHQPLTLTLTLTLTPTLTQAPTLGYALTLINLAGSLLFLIASACYFIQAKARVRVIARASSQARRVS